MASSFQLLIYDDHFDQVLSIILPIKIVLSSTRNEYVKIDRVKKEKKCGSLHVIEYRPQTIFG